MKNENDILDLLKKQESRALTASRKAVIIQPGDVSDCILTLPLVRFLKQRLNIGSVEMIGNTGYIDFLVGRSDLDGVRSIDTVPVERLFEDHKTFDVDDNDPLLYMFGSYGWIVTFINDRNNNFEQNLIYLANCMGPSEITAIDSAAGEKYSSHISQFYVDEYLRQNPIDVENFKIETADIWLNATERDYLDGKEFLRQSGLNVDVNVKRIIVSPDTLEDNYRQDLTHFIELSEKLEDKNLEVVFMFNDYSSNSKANEQIAKLSKQVNVLSDLTISQIISVLINSNALIGRRNLTCCLAGAVGIKTMVVCEDKRKLYRHGPLGPDVEFMDSNNICSAAEQVIGKLNSD